MLKELQEDAWNKGGHGCRKYQESPAFLNKSATLNKFLIDLNQPGVRTEF